MAINTDSFINLMNQEFENNGRSKLFIEGEKAILKDNNPHFIYKCALNINGLDFLSFSSRLSSFKQNDFNAIKIYAVRQYIEINKKMASYKDANTKAHLTNISSLDNVSSDDLGDCLEIAKAYCPELMKDIILRISKCKNISYQTFKACYTAGIEYEDVLPKMVFNNINAMFIKRLSNMTVTGNNLEFIYKLIAHKFIDEKLALDTIINNKSAYPDIRLVCFKRLINLAENRSIYISLAEKLLNDLKLEDNFDTKYIENYLKEFIRNEMDSTHKNLISKKLNTLIQVMVREHEQQEEKVKNKTNKKAKAKNNNLSI